MRLLALVVGPLVALAIAGCGGSEPSLGSAAEIVPREAALYVSADSELDSEQWQRLDELVSRFPGGRGLEERVRPELAKEGLDLDDDVKPALGPTLELVWLDFENDGENVVALTRPDDERKLRALLAKGGEQPVVAEIEGWTAFAESSTVLDRFRAARRAGSLADEEHFDEAMGAVPDDALAKVYVHGEQITAALRELAPAVAAAPGARVAAAAAAGEATEDGFRLHSWSRSTGEGAAQPELGELLDEVPSGALAFVRFAGGRNLSEQLRAQPGLQQMLPGFERQLGISLTELVSLLEGEGVLYVRPAAIVPETTLLLDVDNSRRALATLDRLGARLAPVGGAKRRTTTVGGVQATELDFGPVSVLSAELEGRVVVTTAREGLRALADDGDKLVDDERFGDARDAAGVEDDEDVVVYVDALRIRALAEQVADAADEPIPGEAVRYLEPLTFLVVSQSRDGDEATARLFLGIA